MKIIRILGSSIGVLFLTVPATAKTCEISIEGEVAFFEECLVEDLGNRDFAFSSLDGATRAVTKGNGSGIGMGEATFDHSFGTHDGSIGALYPGGESRREGCWGNRSVEICVFE